MARSASFATRPFQEHALRQGHCVRATSSSSTKRKSVNYLAVIISERWEGLWAHYVEAEIYSLTTGLTWSCNDAEATEELTAFCTTRLVLPHAQLG